MPIIQCCVRAVDRPTYTDLYTFPWYSSNISSGQILSCEYTVHPLWLADNNDGTELWPENLPKQSSQDEMELVQGEYCISISFHSEN